MVQLVRVRDYTIIATVVSSSQGGKALTDHLGFFSFLDWLFLSIFYTDVIVYHSDLFVCCCYLQYLFVHNVL